MGEGGHLRVSCQAVGSPHCLPLSLYLLLFHPATLLCFSLSQGICPFCFLCLHASCVQLLFFPFIEMLASLPLLEFFPRCFIKQTHFLLHIPSLPLRTYRTWQNDLKCLFSFSPLDLSFVKARSLFCPKDGSGKHFCVCLHIWETGG